jgi:hypothetical protein
MVRQLKTHLGVASSGGPEDDGVNRKGSAPLVIID